MRGRRECCGSRYVDRKIRRAVRIKRAVKDNRRCNIRTVRKRLKTVSHGRKINNESF